MPASNLVKYRERKAMTETDSTVFEIKNLHRVTPEEYPELVEMLKGAFYEYPKLCEAFPDREDRTAAIEAVIQFYSRFDMCYGRFYTLDENLDAAVGILHSDYLDYEDDLAQKAGCYSPQYEAAMNKLTPEKREQWDRFFDRLEELENSIEGTPYPHIYVDFLAVRDSKQDKGLGGQILDKLCAYADEEGLPIMLFTNGERQMSFYERHGFRLLGIAEDEEYKLKNMYYVYGA